MKFIIKGKTYRVVKELPNDKELLINKVYLVTNSKQEEYTLVCSNKSYVLYNDKQQRVASTYSIREMD